MSTRPSLHPHTSVLDHNPSAQLSVALFAVERGVGVHGGGGVAVEEDGAEMELLGLGHKFGGSDYELDTGVGSLVGDLSRGEQRVGRCSDGAEGRDGQEADIVRTQGGGRRRRGVEESTTAAVRIAERSAARVGVLPPAGGGVDQGECGRARLGAAEDQVVQGEAGGRTRCARRGGATCTRRPRRIPPRAILRNTLPRHPSK
jgi:hypothetical protein